MRIDSSAIASYFASDGAPGSSDDDDADLTLDADAVDAWLQDAESRRDAPRRPDDLAALRSRLPTRS